MLTSIGSNARIFFCLQATDMRLSFSGLSGKVRSFIGADPVSGDLFIFRNRRGDKLKIFAWQKDGYVQWYKQLERGTFRFPLSASGHSVEIDASTLRLILDGIDLRSVRRQKRYHRPEPNPVASLIDYRSFQTPPAELFAQDRVHPTRYP
jgi:transposase